jgi:hypothetical protein
MPEASAAPDVSGRAPTDELADGCGVCRHAWSAHDQIAARFCTATGTGGFNRECVCTPNTGGTAHDELNEEAR